MSSIHDCAGQHLFQKAKSDEQILCQVLPGGASVVELTSNRHQLKAPPTIAVQHTRLAKKKKHLPPPDAGA